MSFNQKGGYAGHQSSMSAYSNNKINVEESFHNKRDNTSSGELGGMRASYNLPNPTGNDHVSSINIDENGNTGGNES